MSMRFGSFAIVATMVSLGILGGVGGLRPDPTPKPVPTPEQPFRIPTGVGVVSATYAGPVYVAGTAATHSLLDTSGASVGSIARGQHVDARPVAGTQHEIFFNAAWQRIDRDHLVPDPCSTPQAAIVDLEDTKMIRIFTTNDGSSPTIVSSPTYKLSAQSEIRLACGDAVFDATAAPGGRPKAATPVYVAVTYTPGTSRQATRGYLLLGSFGSIAHKPGATWKRP